MEDTKQTSVDYKTRTIAPDERHLILLVLDESVNIGKRYEFNYTGMNDLNHMVLQRLTYIDKTLLEKKALFDKLDQRSYTYNRILQVAKLALRELQDNTEYSYYSADLIYKFLQLEEIFGERQLKAVGVKFLEEQPVSIKERPQLSDEKPLVLPGEDEGEIVPPTLSKKNIKKYNKMKQEQSEIGEALSELDFTDEEIIEDEQVTPSEIKGMDFTD